jgi:molecular chaperone IbpA
MADRSHVAQTKEVMLCVHLILLPTIVLPLVSTGCSPCSTRSAAWKGRYRASYNIARTGENDYRISVAVAGFTVADLAIEAKENTLKLRGEKQTNDEEKSGDVLYQGIAARNFERSFQLADHVQVKGASLENGLLHIDLVREIPEAMKPRAIPIASSSKVLEVQPTKLAA